MILKCRVALLCAVFLSAGCAGRQMNTIEKLHAHCQSLGMTLDRRVDLIHERDSLSMLTSDRIQVYECSGPSGVLLVVKNSDGNIHDQTSWTNGGDARIPEFFRTLNLVAKSPGDIAVLSKLACQLTFGAKQMPMWKVSRLDITNHHLTVVDGGFGFDPSGMPGGHWFRAEFDALGQLREFSLVVAN